MELHIFYINIYICCVLIVSYIEAKSISLNDIIAAERRATGQTISTSGTYSPDNNNLQRSKTSPFKYRKAFEIRSPSKPKKLKHLQKPRLRHKNLLTKRVVRHDESINKKYIPLLKNIGMLFDNILSTDSSETYNPRIQKYKRNPVNTESDDVVCTCVKKYDTAVKINTRKETTPSPFTTEIKRRETSVIATTTPPYNTAADNDGRLGRNKNISLLSEGNTTGIRRINYRFRERSSSSLNRGFQGHITGDYGNNEHYTHVREDDSDTEYNEEHTDSNTRDNAISDRTRRRGSRVYSRDPEIDRTETTDNDTISSNGTTENNTGHISGHEREAQFKIRGNETKSSTFLSEFTTGLRGIKPKEKKIPFQTSETVKKNIELNHSGNKQLTDRDGTVPAENQKISGTDKTMIPKNFKANSNFPGKVVMIFDGYSVARDVNGENKISEKAIHIHG